jgi:hypothetical protein
MLLPHQTDERVKLLEECGFVWDSHEASWREKVQDLIEFIREHGHANVSSSYKKSPQLATWVKVR